MLRIGDNRKIVDEIIINPVVYVVLKDPVFNIYLAVLNEGAALKDQILELIRSLLLKHDGDLVIRGFRTVPV